MCTNTFLDISRYKKNKEIFNHLFSLKAIIYSTLTVFKVVSALMNTVKDSDLNFFWAPKLSAGGLNFGLDSQYGN